MDARSLIEEIERSNQRRRNPAVADWEDAVGGRLEEIYEFDSYGEAAAYVNAFEEDPDVGRVEAEQPAVVGETERDGALDRVGAGGMDTGIGRYYGYVVRDMDAYEPGR